MDEAITRWINAGAGRSSVLDAIVIGIAVAGVPLMVLAVVGLWWSRSKRTHLRQVAVEAGLSTLGGLAFNQIVLLFIHRPRPYVAGVSHLMVAPSADWSFPSDHATVAFAIAATFALSNERNRAFRSLGMVFTGALRCRASRAITR